MSDNQNDKPYNGAAYGFSPYDMDARECRYWAIEHLADDDDDDYDCCDDADDYGEEDESDDNTKND